MDSIVVGFSKPKGWFEPFSWLIRLVTWSAYSHAYIKYYNSYASRWEIFQASGLKVNFVGATLFDSEEVICKEFTIPITTQAKLELVQFAIDNVGKPYGVGQIFGILWVLFMRAFGIKVKNPFASSSSDFCSELTEEVLNKIVGEGDPLDPSASTPKDLCVFLESKGLKSTI